MSAAGLKIRPDDLADTYLRLANPGTRSEAALEFARLQGASECAAFILDEEINQFLLAPGFKRSLRRRRDWQAFLQDCVDRGRATAMFEGADDSTSCVTGWAYGRQRVLALFHSPASKVALPEQSADRMELLFRLLEQEHLCKCLSQERRVAMDRIQELETLATGLEETRMAVSTALMDAKVAKSRSENILETISDAFIAVDHDERISYFNRKSLALFVNDDRLQLLGRSLWSVLKVDEVFKLRDGCHQAKSTGSTQEFELRDEGARRVYQVCVYPSPEGASLLLRDVTRRKEMEALVRDLSTPVLHVEPHLLLLPVIGRLDRERAAQLTENYLAAIRAYRAKAGVMDLTGVADLDNESTGRICSAVQSAKLLGCTTFLVGIASNTARAFIESGLGPQEFNVELDLESGVKAGRRRANGAFGTPAT